MACRIIFFSLVFLLGVPYVYCQTSGKIIASSTKEPVPYATIFIKNRNIGFHSDSDGNFTIAAQLLENDSLYVQALGFKTAKLRYTKDIPLSVITLDEAPILLQQVTVKKKNKPGFVWKGAKEEHKGFIFGQMGGSILREVALYIPNDDKLKGFLDEVAFYIVRFGQHKTPFRVHVYEAIGDMPGKELLSGNVILAGKRPNKYTTVDISSYNIPFGENGVFISMEWLNLNDKKYFYTIKHYNSKATDTYYGQQIGLSGEFEELYGRVRINNGPWKKMTAGFASPMFRAKISY